MAGETRVLLGVVFVFCLTAGGLRAQEQMEQEEYPQQESQEGAVEAEKAPVSDEEVVAPTPPPEPEPEPQEEVRDESQGAAPALVGEEVAPLPNDKIYQKAGYELIAGPLPKVLKAGEKPYLVVADIEVPANRMVTIEPGAVLMFRNFTGLHVQGRLVAEGTKSDPIVFTSELDSAFNKLSKTQGNPFDWDGIYIHDDGIGTVLTFCKVAYSVYGIRSDTKFIRIEPAMFRANGKSNLIIEGVEHEVGRKPYAYVLSTKDATVDGVPVDLLRDPAAPRRNFLRYTGLSVLVIGAGMSIYEATQWAGSQDTYDKLSSVEFGNLNENESKDWEKARDDRNMDILYTALSGGVGLLGGIGLIWSFTF